MRPRLHYRCTGPHLVLFVHPSAAAPLALLIAAPLIGPMWHSKGRLQPSRCQHPKQHPADSNLASKAARLLGAAQHSHPAALSSSLLRSCSRAASDIIWGSCCCSGPAQGCSQVLDTAMGRLHGLPAATGPARRAATGVRTVCRTVHSHPACVAVRHTSAGQYGQTPAAYVSHVCRVCEQRRQQPAGAEGDVQHVSTQPVMGQPDTPAGDYPSGRPHAGQCRKHSQHML